MLGRDGLGGVAGQGDRALRGGGLQQDRQLDRGEVLHLVDHEVLVGQRPALGARERAALELVDAQQQGVVLDVERVGLVVLVGGAAGAQPLALARTSGAARRAGRRENRPGRVALEAGAQRAAIGEQRRPFAHHVARARAQRAPGSLDGVARRRGRAAASFTQRASAVTRWSTGPTLRVPGGQRRLGRRACPASVARQLARQKAASSACAVVQDLQHRAVRLGPHHHRRGRRRSSAPAAAGRSRRRTCSAQAAKVITGTPATSSEGSTRET